MFTQISSESVGKVHVVNFNAHRIYDPIMIEELGAELKTLFSQEPDGKFLLDLKNVEFLSSAVLNQLIVLDKQVKANSGVLAFSSLCPAVEEVFAITKLDLLFKIFGTRDEALDELQ